MRYTSERCNSGNRVVNAVPPPDRGAEVHDLNGRIYLSGTLQVHTLVFAGPGVAKTDVFLHPVKMQSNASRHLLRGHKNTSSFCLKKRSERLVPIGR